MPDSKKNSSRIAKNTLFLYARMLLLMLVSLYTSRLVLDALGVVSFGVFNVVAGVVASLSFLNSSLATSTQRYLNYEMGRCNERETLREIFSNAINAHYIIAAITFVLLETIGLWFVTTQLTIPDENQNAAFWIYQTSIFSVIVTIVSTPYNAAIIAHEKMNVFAYFSILECFLKLAVVLSLFILPFNRLLVYGFLLLCVTLIMRIMYNVYCIKNFSECKYKWGWNRKLIRNMFSFTGWMFFGCISDMLSNQGVNMLINIFFGPVCNASRAIAYQVFNAVNSFVSNFIVAVKPQIVKSYAAKDFDYMHRLVFSSTKISFYLLLLLTLPLFVNMELILGLWLNNVPELACLFTRLVLVDLWIRSAYTPIAQVNQASGRIRSYQLAISIIFFMIFFVTLILFNFDFPVYYAFIVAIAFNFIGIFVRLAILRKENSFPSSTFIKKVLCPLFPVTLLSLLPSYFLHIYMSESMLNFIFNTILGFFISLIIIWMIGLDCTEKTFVKNKIKAIRKRV